MIRLAGLLIVLSLWLPGAAAFAQSSPVSKTVAAGPQRTERIEAELVPMSAWAAPGSTAIVAVRQAIKPGWHTYWRNPGDSGGATVLSWTLPASATPGDIVWPLPERQRLQGLMNYGYSGVVYLPVPIQISPDVRAGSTLTLTVRAAFFVCSAEMCVPEDLTLALDLPVRDAAAPPDRRHGAAIAQVLAQAAGPAGIDARMTLEDGALRLTATGGPLAGRDPGPSYFYPFESGVIDHAAAQAGTFGPNGLMLALAPGGEALTGAAVRGVLSTGLGAFEIEAQVGPPLAGVSGTGLLAPAPEAVTTPGSATGGGLATFLQAAVFALLGGLILNLMPCVFPVLAMKAASLTGAAHEPARARRDGLAFLAGVLTTFMLLAGALLALRAGGQAVGWGFQLQSPPVTAVLALLMLAVALNLSGVFHIGSGLQGAGSGPLSRLPGGTGAFFTGTLAVVVAAPCTAPFMAFALGAAVIMPWPMAMAVFLMLGLGLALPYLLVSLSPGLLSRLPRPGPWMERLKGGLAFPMYGAALWLAWVFGRQTGTDPQPLLMLAGLALALGLWLIGIGQMEQGFGRRGVLHLTAGAVVVVAAGAALSLAVRSPVEATTGEAAASRAPVSQSWSPAAVDIARSQGRPVLVNFTADWCVTCKINERAALSSAGVKAAMARSNAVYLVGDWTRRDAAIAAELQRHGRSGVPLYLLYSPGSAEPRILPQLLTEGVVVEALAQAR